MTASHNTQDRKYVPTDECEQSYKYNENEQDREFVEIDERKKSYEYNEEDRKVVSSNNAKADLDQFWRESKEYIRGMMYDIGTWLAKTYKNCTKKVTTHNPNTQVERVQQVKEIEMDAFITDSQDGEWEKINHEDCLLSDKELDMSKYEIVDHDDCLLPDEKFDMNKGKIVDNGQPRTNLSIAGKVSDFIGRLLG